MSGLGGFRISQICPELLGAAKAESDDSIASDSSLEHCGDENGSEDTPPRLIFSLWQCSLCFLLCSGRGNEDGDRLKDG